MNKQKDRVKNRNTEQKQIEEDRENYIKSLPHPYEKELETCEHIVNYLTELKRKAGLLQDSEVVAQNLQTNFLSEAAKQQLQKKVEEGKIQHAMSKHERQEQEMVRVGGGKKKGKKPKMQDVAQEFEFNVDIVVIKKFGLIQVSPPVNVDELDSKIAEIQKKQAFFTENGENKLKEQIAELRKENEQRAKEETKKEDVDDGVVFESRGRGRGRGGANRGAARGRGGYDDRGRGRGGNATRGRQDFRIKSEFEGDSDDEYTAPQAKTTQGKRKQKTEDLKIDDDNYPTL